MVKGMPLISTPADGGVGATEAFFGKEFGNHRALDVSRVVGIVQEAADGHQQVADVAGIAG